jgi:hypothetical protein
MLTVHATLQPNGQVQLPPSLAKGRPVAVLVTILEPLPEAEQPPLLVAPTEAGHSPQPSGKGSVANLMALLQSPEFVALPKADPQEVEERIQALRNDWNDE